MMRDKVILTDADGGLLNWSDSFDAWMARRGHFAEGDVRLYNQTARYGWNVRELVHHFNASANIGFLPPLYDSRKFVRKLYEEFGYTFLVVSSLSDDPYAQKLRTQNLTDIFGTEVFEDFIYLGCGADKDKPLKKLSKIYPGAWWLEDKVKNAKLGKGLGLESILMAHPHIKMEDTDGIQIVKSWYDLYKTLTGDY